MPDYTLQYGIGDNVGSDQANVMMVAGAVDGNTVTWDVILPETTAARPNWFFDLPAGVTLTSLRTFGAPIPFSNDPANTDPLWGRATNADESLYVGRYGSSGAQYSVVITATISSPPGAIERAIPTESSAVSRVRYAAPSFTAPVMTAIQGELRQSIRVSNTTEENAHLWRLFLASLAELEIYLNHALIQRTFTSFIRAPSVPGQTEYLVPVAGAWRTVMNVSNIRRGNVALASPTYRDGVLRVFPDMEYTVDVTLGPFDGPADGTIGADVKEAVIRMVGWRYDAGIYQGNAMLRSGALELVARYTNREALIV